jgi:hypothetical protein
MGRKFLIVALGVVCLALISAGGARMLSCTSVDATNKATPDLALTIYNQNFAVVRQPVALNFESGLSHMRFSDITAHVEPDSVILRDTSGDNKLQILEQNYRNDPISEPLLLSLYEGKELEFEDPNNHGKVIKGKVIRSGYVPHYAAMNRYGQQYYYQQVATAEGSTPIIEIDGKLHFGLPGKPIFPALVGDTIMKPSFDWLVHSSKTGAVSAELSYVTGGMQWQADYNVVAPPHGDVLDLVGWVTMDNQSGKSFEQAHIKLMAGELSKIQPAEYGMRDELAYAQKAAAANGAPQVQEKSFDEYHLYTLPRPVSLHDRETKQVEFIQAAGVQSQRVYVYDGAKIDPNRYGYYSYEQIRGDRSYGTESNPSVWVMQEIKNTKANNMGMALPKGRVRFYRRDDDGQLEFTGENVIRHTPSDETLRIFTGDAFDIVGERRQTDYRVEANQRWIDETFEIKLRNHKKEAVEVRAVEHMYRCVNWEVTKSTDRFDKTDSHTGEFRVRIPANGEKTITYLVHYTW